MENNTGIREAVLEQIRSLAVQHGLKRVILFGSRARGDFRERSDIDLAVSGGHIAAFSLDVDEETDTLLQYDVINLDVPVDKALLESIQREGVTLYEKV